MSQPARQPWEYLPDLAGAQLPRYTSYPPANRFTSDVAAADVERELASLPESHEVSVYIHIPFCHQLCWYCGCHASVPTRANPLDSYVHALLQEIELVGQLMGRHRVAHVHFGGGSPNVLTPEQVDAIFGRLNDTFRILPDAEICAEFDPRSVPSDTLEAYVGGGLSRVSLGVQVLDPKVQALINRIQPTHLIDDLLDRLRNTGVSSINMDVMYGLPEQSTEHVLETAAYAADRDADRIAVFGYAHVPWFKKHQGAIKTAMLASGEERFRQAEAAANLLLSRGYTQIGFDHYALPDDKLAVAARDRTLRRNFQGYTSDTSNDLIAFGASAISSIGRLYFQNTPDTAQYRQRLGERQLATVRGAHLQDSDLATGRVISDLLCNMQADIPSQTGEHERAQLDQFASRGLVEIEGDLLRVTTRGAPYVRNIAAAFDPELRQAQTRHSLAV